MLNDKFQNHVLNYKIRNRKNPFVANFSAEMPVDDFLDNLANELNKGADLIILKTTAPSRISLEIAKKSKLLCAEFGATFLIYDRADIVLLTEADGIIIDKDSFSNNEIQKILGENFIIEQIPQLNNF